MKDKEKDGMMYVYKTGKKGDLKQVSIAELQASAKYQLAQEFKEKRKNIKMTQTKLSELTGIPQPNVTRFESGKSNPTLELMVKMAAAMNMELEITLKEK